MKDFFVALTQCDKLVLRKWQNAKKGDMVKNHCTEKIILGYLLYEIEIKKDCRDRLLVVFAQFKLF